jgi:membrane protein DedA with SNARE-associated domain
MRLLESIEPVLVSFSDKVPLEIFISAGSFIEEIIAPIPSFLVVTVAGSVAALQEKPLAVIFWLAIFGALGKLAGAWVLYVFADKAEDLVLGRFGKVLGISHKEVESIGKHLNRGRRDLFLLILLRALPIISSALISVVCGVLKVNRRTYVISTLVGTYIKDLIFLYFGFAGIASFESTLHGLNSLESKIQVLSVVAIFLLLAGVYWKRRRTHI